MTSRILAIGSLAAVVLATLGILTAQGGTSGSYREGLRQQFENNLVAVDRVSDELQKLEPGASPKAAKAAVREAMATVKPARTWVAETMPGRDWVLAERASVALQRQAAWLDAVGSILNNPRSKLTARVRSRAKRTKTSLSGIVTNPGAAAAVQGTDELLAHAKSRRKKR